MPKPVTPFVGCDTFAANEKKEVLLIRRKDSGLWALPGGGQDLGETPAKCAIRECKEETGYEVEVKRLLGVFSSSNYKYVHYQWKENEFAHILFLGEIIGGKPKISAETTEVGWFSENNLPELFDGHKVRIQVGFSFLKDPSQPAHFE